MPRYRVDIAYDGTRYAGWQIQPNRATIQDEIQRAIQRVVGLSVAVYGSSRTDAGVHARRQVAHADIPTAQTPTHLLRAVNAVLPSDIRILRIRRVPRSFHARNSVHSKEYRYFIWNATVVPPWLRLYRTHVPRLLDVSAMREAARRLLGRHDFTAFAANPDRVVENTVRHLMELRIVRRGPELIVIARADGFLYRMVRSVVGFLMRVGKGDLCPDDTQMILRSRRRTAQVPTAPPQGLFLWNVRY